MEYYTIILFFPDNINRRPTKYHKITNIDKFRQFAVGTGANCMNVYNKETKEFKEQIRLI